MQEVIIYITKYDFNNTHLDLSPCIIFFKKKTEKCLNGISENNLNSDNIMVEIFIYILDFEYVGILMI